MHRARDSVYPTGSINRLAQFINTIRVLGVDRLRRVAGQWNFECYWSSSWRPGLAGPGYAGVLPGVVLRHLFGHGVVRVSVWSVISRARVTLFISIALGQ